ncbi:alpha/beta fold hydrolase [Pseudalkalibacillus decolorationis]|uniref:alpha/beta fold hydrolase n=1 Tax=Pseudalkalibacillus decolorationis TaxID=163879 RepID=UPI002148A1A3|nr:alpha/beta hydrolase [Pseudalkalibacillus decolorationis]
MELTTTSPLLQVNPSKRIQVQHVEVYYEEYGEIRNDAPSLLMIHGFLSSCFSFRRLIPLLRERYHIVAIDLPGFGQSEKSRKFFYSLKNYGQLVVDLMNALQIQNAILIGHSMGGQIALHAGRLAPDRIKKFILLGCSGYLKRPNPTLVRCSYLPFFVLILKRYIGKKGVRENLLTVVHNPKIIDDQLIEGYRKPFDDKEMFYALIRVLRHREGDMLPEELSEVRHPVLLLWGRHDRIIPLPVGERLVKDLPNAQLKIYEQAGHLLPEEIPEEISEEIGLFITETK